MVIDRECLHGHMNIKFLILHEVFVEKIQIERLCFANVRNASIIHIQTLPPSVRSCMPAETDDILPITALVDGASGQAIHVEFIAYRPNVLRLSNTRC